MTRSLRSWLGHTLTGSALLAGAAALAIAQDGDTLHEHVHEAPLPIIEVTPSGTLPDTGEENYASRVIACFDQGTPAAVVQEVQGRVDALNRDLIGDRYDLGSRWSGTQGTPITLTWSFAPDGLSIPNGIGEGAGNNSLFATMDSAFGGNRALWISRFEDVFNRWSQITGINYQRITVGGNDWDDGASWGSSGAAGLRGDIRICAKFIDGGSNVLAYNYFPATGTGGNMQLDEDENWGSSTNFHRFLRNTISHEHGHGIGLRHVCPVQQTKLMEPFLTTSFDGPRHDDFRAGQRHYGDPYEPDNTSATAVSLGTLTFGTAVTPCAIPAPISGTSPASSSICSIDANGEADFFSFAVTGSATCNVTLTPVGLSYEDCPQDPNCTTASCASTTNSATQANVAVQLISTDGTTVIVDASAAAAGSAETISGASLPSAGTYFVRVYETDAPTQSQLYTLSITATSAGCTAPAITGQPSNQTVCSGVSTSLTATASGTSPTFQWRRGTTNIVNGGAISGATSATLTINPVAVSDAGTNYNCVVTNACGNATTNNATITVNSAPTISAQPPLRTVCAGSSTTFTVTATGTPAPTFQWRRGTTNLVNGGSISGATTATLTINPVATGDAGTNYNCVVTNTCGTVTSNNGTLTVNTAPAITAQPPNRTVCSGTSTTFTVTATGTPTPTFQWRRGTTNLVNGGNISGATTATLTINPVGAGDAATNYNCVVTNACSSATSNNGSLTVNTAAAVTGQPANTAACVGASAAFTVTASGSPAPTFQWRRGTTNLVNGGNIAGATSATLTINPVGAGDAATNYNCVVTNTCGSGTSNNATLTVNTAASVSGQPANTAACIGASAAFTVAAGGSPAPTFQWRRGATNLVNGGNISGATSATLTINPVGAGDAASNYNCVVTNACGNATSNNATLTVNTTASVSGQPSSASACSGGSAAFTVTASGSPAPTFQWRRGTTNLVNAGNISGATTATLTINPVGSGDAASNYNCVVTNACGAATSNNATLTVNTGPAITGNPANAAACIGASAAFTVSATGSPAPTFQWRRGTTNLANGGNISGATSATLTINPVGAGDTASDYNCVVTNACGAATSNNALLTVNTEPAITGNPANAATCIGASAAFTVSATGSPAPTFQWRRGTTNLVNGGNISGATSATLTINPVGAGDAASDYNCVVTNACGSATSNNASLMANAGPSISGQPANQSICDSGSAAFSVTASGATAFQWRRGATNLVDGGSTSGATTATLTINPAGAGDAATDYNCVVSNACGNSTSDNASLTVGSGPSISGQPSNQSLCGGGSASFSITASGATTFQWRRGTTNLVD
ncbi:MAG: immunoglobulin domain-containing protein, partial [Phycisphaerae bacterium]